jgi:hypothetical protein
MRKNLLLISNRPLSSLSDCEWVIENYDALVPGGR